MVAAPLFILTMSKTWIEIDSQCHWFEDGPAAIWFRVMSLNLNSDALFSLTGWDEVGSLREALMVQSELYGASNCMGLDLNEYIKSTANGAYFAASVRRVNKIFDDFGGCIDSPCLRALGFTGDLASASDTRSISAIGTLLLSVLASRAPP